jgi:hypothetical protein
MTSRGFLFLLVVTVAAITVASQIAERFTAPGLERTLAVAVLTALVLMPAARWAERRGWIKGELQLGRSRAAAAGGTDPAAGTGQDGKGGAR